ncbi:cell cycle checkpoint control protein RAD9A isoform X1 [Balaenoptera ricei]|uniref:cell cycle checkpoint control protein RAD9A isoform X1 n=2 Tax=Balaenoptera ricei TaxID=2746895 RepID=UPI0028BEED18|nr:cell cycle checkpoint control protein RAD9A isoform X1 [Balaenoptera ricei]XP_059788143.1 cell cycle checkpoint control protein RAD9A isoform X1 [Balaenoptera ricei]
MEKIPADWKEREGFSRRWWKWRTLGQVCEQKPARGLGLTLLVTASLSLLFLAQLSLRTVNSSRSAYACFLFAPLFFQQYQAATPGQDPLRCKILMKSFLSVFRSLAMLEKTVEKCCISLNGRSSRLVVQLYCKYGVRKTHNLSFQDCESLQAVFDPAVCPHVLRAPARVLGEAVLPFPPALAEVTLGIGRGHRVILRSYQEEAGEGARHGLGQGAEMGWDGAGPRFPPVAVPTDSTVKAMVTEMSIGGEDFQQLQAQEGVAITFCLKEFRGLLSFADSANLSLSIYFDGPGRPAIFAIKDSLLDGHFVLATLSEPDPHPQDLRGPELQRPAPQLQAHSTPQLDDFALDDIDSYMIAMETTVGSEGSRTLPSTSLSPGLQPPCSPGSHSEEEDDTEPSTVPGTPPPKKFRSLFFGSILAPAHSPQGPSPVLAEDSEGEG